MSGNVRWERDGAVLVGRVYEGAVFARLYVSEEHVLVVGRLREDHERGESRATGESMSSIAGGGPAEAFELMLEGLALGCACLPPWQMLEDAVRAACRK